MKVKIQNIFSLIIAVFVLFLSMGINISKMACDKESNIYFGVQEFSCSIDGEAICQTSKQEVSCCSVLVEKTCLRLSAGIFNTVKVQTSVLI